MVSKIDAKIEKKEPRSWDKTAEPALVHLNGNLLCAIDTETTGLDPKTNDIVQICILPLNSYFKPSKQYKPFICELKPRYPENADSKAMEINKKELAHCCLVGIDYFKASERLEEWFESLNLGPYKKIIPLGQNFPFDRSFMVEWLGPFNYNHMFHRHFRDTCATALFLNDVADMKNMEIPFPHVNLAYLAETLKVPHSGSHDAVIDCQITAEVYRRLLMFAQ